MASTQQVNIIEEQFETSKKEFIQSVRLGYERFLKENGVDLESEIRTKVRDEIKQKKEKKANKLKEEEQEQFRVIRLGLVCDMLCELEYRISDRINEFYGDLVDVEIISEWYYNDCNVTMEFMWGNKKLNITNYDGQLQISGGKKELRKYIKTHKKLMKEFLDVSDEYYYLNDEYYTSSSKNSE